MGLARIGKVLRQLNRITHALDLDRPGLAEDLHAITVDVIERDTADEVSYDGQPLPALTPEYAAWKARHYPGKTIGEREGLMLDRENLMGEMFVSPEEIRVVYGTSEQAREEATYFEDAGRRFFGFSAESIQRVGDFMLRRLEAAVR